MSTDESVSFSLEINVEEAYTNIRQLQTVMFRTIALMRKMGLPEDIDEGIMKIQRFITLTNQARLTVAAFYAASGPLGWALAGLSLATTAVMIPETIEYATRGT